MSNDADLKEYLTVAGLGRLAELWLEYVAHRKALTNTGVEIPGNFPDVAFRKLSDYRKWCARQREQRPNLDVEGV